MPLFVLSDSLEFPPAGLARPDGLLAIGGDLSVRRLLSAYCNGIFPWFNEGDPILWWSPDPRLVLYPEELHVSRRLERTVRQGKFEVSFDQAFDQVIENCAKVRRHSNDGTWITGSMIAAYGEMFRQGWCRSVEAWYRGKLVGGLYGVQIDRVFFGESMFTIMTDASKVAFVHAIRRMHQDGVKIIDCQVPTGHLARFGARLIPRDEFLKEIERWTFTTCRQILSDNY